MDFETAELQAGYLNEILTEYLDTIYYKVFALWNTQYDKQYQTVLIPTKYTDNYDTAGESIQLAFARVSIKTLVLPYSNADDFVTNFDSVILNDPELYAYLNPKP